MTSNTTRLIAVVRKSEVEKVGEQDAPKGFVSAKEWGRTAYYGSVNVHWHGEATEPSLVSKHELWVLEESGQEVPFKVNGVGPDAPIETAENGAKQSATPFATTSLPPKALLAVAAVQKGGDDKYGVDNWRDLPIVEHLNHAQVHYLAHMAGDTTEKHLEHYATRALMALELWLEQKGIVG